MADGPDQTDVAPSGEPDERKQVLAETRLRLGQLEAEAYRLRAQLARLEADGQEQAAERIESELLRLADEQSALRHDEGGDPPPIDRPTRSDNGAGEAKPASDLLAGLAAGGPDEPFSLGGAAAGNGGAPTEPSGRSKPGGPSKPGGARRAGKQLRGKTPTAHKPDGVADVTEAPVIAKKEDDGQPRPWASRLRDAPAVAASLGVHAVLLLIFFFWTIVTLTKEPPVLQAGAVDGSDEFFDEFTDVDFSPEELETTELEEMDLELASEVSEVDPSELDAPWDDAAAGMTDLSAGATSALPADAGSLMLGDAGGQPTGAGRGERPDGGGKPGSTQFFGARSKGNRFVFIVDNSGSMKEGRMETTLIELQRAVMAMSSKQMFYVIFYSDQAYPMFFPNGVDAMAPATRENKQKLAAWLPTVEICLGGRLNEAMEMAERLDPAVVYLLSDGDIRSTRTMEDLTTRGDREFIIHTFGMTVRQRAHA
ncbi:MAG: VWA domain-containing protein, partial [Planctomycetota bacterium]